MVKYCDMVLLLYILICNFSCFGGTNSRVVDVFDIVVVVVVVFVVVVVAAAAAAAAAAVGTVSVAVVAAHDLVVVHHQISDLLQNQIKIKLSLRHSAEIV